MKRFDKFARLEGKTFIELVDNCSPHNITYTEFSNFKCSFLPPNLTSHLQPVDAAVGRSFNCDFRRLLVLHILDAIDGQICRNTLEREPFNIGKVVALYDAVRLMSKAWDLVPESVVLNAWLKTDILPYFLRQKIFKLRNEGRGNVRASLRAPATYAPGTVLEARKKSAKTAYYAGELYIRAEQQAKGEESDTDTDYGARAAENSINCCLEK